MNWHFKLQTPIAQTIEICQQRLQLPYFKETLTDPKGYTLANIAHICYYCYADQYHHYFPQDYIIEISDISIILYSVDVGHVIVEIIHDCESDQ